MAEIEEIYLKSEEISNLHETLNTFISDLREAQINLNPDGYNQVVLQLNPDLSGEQWKMFVYYSTERESFYFSYQNEEYEDTDLTYGYDYDRMIAQMEEEIQKVGGFEWIARDQDE